eukprot:4560964-Pleurochrysis_carterae.AAC.2
MRQYISSSNATAGLIDSFIKAADLANSCVKCVCVTLIDAQIILVATVAVHGAVSVVVLAAGYATELAPRYTTEGFAKEVRAAAQILLNVRSCSNPLDNVMFVRLH